MMFKIKSQQIQEIVDDNFIDVKEKSKIKIVKTCVLTMGMLLTLSLVSCGEKDNSASSISELSPSVTKNETNSKLQLLPLCEPNNNLIAYFETKHNWINICGEGNQKFFTRQLKSDHSQLIRIPAYWNQENSAFLASSGDTIYAINEKELKIWHNSKLVKEDTIDQSRFKFNSILTQFKLPKIPKAISAITVGAILATIYIYGEPYIHRLGSNGRAIAYIVSIVAWPGIIVTSLAIAEIPLTLLAPLTGALALGFSFGSKQVVENAATVALNLRDDVYEVGDIIGFAGDDDFYQVTDIKTSTVKLLSLAGNSGRILNISPSVLAQKEFVNYTQNGADTLCKWVFPISLKAQVAQPGKGDMTKMEDSLLQAAKEVQQWIIQNTKHPEAKAAFAAEATKDRGRQDIPAGVFLTKVEKFIHHYAIALWIPGVEIYRVASISNELFHHVWHHAVENHNLELATANSVDDTDIVEATQAIAQSFREGLGKVSH
ncbi:MAG: hypothetical protein AAGE84_09050 [Cyanobacteria bacterium P01_G01_bin.39]